MSSIEQDSIYNSSNDGDGEASLPRPPPGFTPIRSSDESVLARSQDQDNVNEMGLDLGRRLARLELGNKLNKEQMEKIEKQCEIREETLVLENSRVNELKGKLISMEARLSSEEKQGFDIKEKVERLEKLLVMKDQESLELKKSLANEVGERAKLEGRLARLEQGNGQLTSQFITLLETCEKFNDELQLLKKMNVELKRELKKKEINEVNATEDTQPTPSGCHPSKLKISSNDVLTPYRPDQLKVTRQPPTVKVAQNQPTKNRMKINSTIHQFIPQGVHGQDFIPPGVHAKEFIPPGVHIQDFIPPNYFYSGPSGSTAFYYPPAPQPTLMFYPQGAGAPPMKNADFTGYQNRE